MGKKYSELEKLVESYFDLCDGINSTNEKKILKPYTMAGFLYHTGMSRKNFEELIKKRPYRKLLTDAKMKIEAFIEEKSMTGELSINASQGSLKYNFGWGEKDERKDESTHSIVIVELSDEAKELAT